MPTARALLVVLPDPELAGEEALARVAAALSEFGFEDLATLPEGPTLTPKAVHAAIDALIDRVGPDDPCVFYYFGHGGRVRFEGLPGPAEDRAYAFLRCGEQREGFDGLLDVALSHRLARLARACGNLTVILDACHSATIVRSSARRRPAPAWVCDELAALAGDDELAGASQSATVRIAGATPWSRAQTQSGARGLLGRLTVHLCEELHAIASRAASVSWDALAHRLRGRIIATARSEHQWLVVAGPRERGLFSSRPTSDARSVGFVATSPASGWIWAGALQGVELGDAWLVANLEDQAVARGVVVEVGLNRARLELDRELESLAHGHARLVRAQRPSRVELDARLRGTFAERLARSAWLREAIPELDDPSARLELDGDALLVTDLAGRWPSLRFARDEHEAAFELLDDRARSGRLLGITSGAPSLRVEGLPNTLRAGDPLVLRLECDPSEPDCWFVQLVLVDGLGRAWLLAPSQPEGIELCRGELESHALRVSWPAQASGDALPCSVVVLACGRPLQLGHLARPHPDDHEAFASALRLSPERRGVRGPAEPLLTRRGGVLRLAFTLTRGAHDQP